MQFIVSVNVKEHLVNPERFFVCVCEATQSSENARAFEFRKPGFDSQLLSGCDQGKSHPLPHLSFLVWITG